jgi:ribose transport system substrate-binding protein
MRWHLRSLGWVGLGLLSLTAATGCGSGTRQVSGSGAAGTGDKRIIILTNGNSPFWDASRVGLQEAEKDLGLNKAGYRAVLEVNDSTPQGQIDKLRQFASQSDIVAIGISPCDAANLAVAELMRDLKRKGVQIVTIDSDMDREKLRDTRFAFIGTDNLAGGRELGKCIRNLRPEGGSYVTFVGRTGAQNAMDRIEGVREGAGDKFKALDTMADDTDLTRARENVRNGILNHPELNTLIGIWSYNAPAIADVVKDMNNRDHFTIAAFDAEPGAIQAMGKGMIDAMVVQNPFQMGYQGVRLLKALVEQDKKTIAEMFPNREKPEGDLYDTGIKVVVPDQGSRLKPEMFDKKTQFLKLTDFRAWLTKYHLTGS